MINPTTTITAITGHLQYVAAIQLSQLLKLFLISLAESVIPLRSSTGRSEAATKPMARPPRLLAMATSIDGMFLSCGSQVTLLEFP